LGIGDVLSQFPVREWVKTPEKYMDEIADF